MPTIKLETTLHRKDIKGSWTYCVLRDAANVFGSHGKIQVKGTLDGFAVEGTLIPRGDGSHWFAVKKEWRVAINKSIGDSVTLVLQDVTLTHTAPDDLIKAISKSKKAKHGAQ